MKEKLIEALNNFSERERVILVGFLSFVMIFIFVAIWFFMSSSIEDKKNTIVEQEKMIQEMVSKKELFKKAQAQNTQMQDSMDSSNVNLNSDISTVRSLEHRKYRQCELSAAENKDNDDCRRR